MHHSIKEIVPKLNAKLEGHYRYYGIFDNYKALESFTRFVVEALYRVLRRRGQRKGWLTRVKLYETLESLKFIRPKLYLLSGY